MRIRRRRSSVGLLDEIRAAHEEMRPGPRCSVRAILDDLDEEDRADLERALADRTYPYSVVSEVLRRRGIEIRAYSLSRHHRGLCGCAR
jgi:hypothetical protein